MNEANRIKHKHILTLQQGISKNQMDEMKDENLNLVVPKPLHTYYPKDYQDPFGVLVNYTVCKRKIFGLRSW